MNTNDFLDNRDYNNKITNLIHQFSLKQESHPGLTKLWINYLTLKQKKLNDLIDQATHTIENISTTNDVSVANVLTMSILYDSKFI
tara:strand:- start:4621 stop:4878 length:258 start_codon:yes stop_codon:yes gene_type:complete